MIVFVGLREGYLTDLFLFSLGRGYFSLSSPDVHWDQLNVLRSCTLRYQSKRKLYFQNGKLHQVENQQGRVNFQETFNLREIKPLRCWVCFIFVTMFVDNVCNEEQFVKTLKNKFYLVPFTKEPKITFLYMILSMGHKVNT